MKLIYCDSCHDVVRLIHTRWRMCECKKSGGQYNQDKITATVGGPCRVLGIPNPFFDEVFPYLTDRGKQWYRDKTGPWGTTDCWYGETSGDKQIFRIASGRGPVLKTQVKIQQWSVFIVDKRDYVIDSGKPEFVDCEGAFNPSFKGKVKLKKTIKRK